MTARSTGETPAADVVPELESCGVVVDGRDPIPHPGAHRLVTAAVDVTLILFASIVALGGLVGISHDDGEGLPVPSAAMTAVGGGLMVVGIGALCVGAAIGLLRVGTRRGPYWIAAAALFGAGFLAWLVG